MLPRSFSLRANPFVWFDISNVETGACFSAAVWACERQHPQDGRPSPASRPIGCRMHHSTPYGHWRRVVSLEALRRCGAAVLRCCAQQARRHSAVRGLPIDCVARPEAAVVLLVNAHASLPDGWVAPVPRLRSLPALGGEPFKLAKLLAQSQPCVSPFRFGNAHKARPLSKTPHLSISTPQWRRSQTGKHSSKHRRVHRCSRACPRPASQPKLVCSSGASDRLPSIGTLSSDRRLHMQNLKKN